MILASFSRDDVKFKRILRGVKAIFNYYSGLLFLQRLSIFFSVLHVFIQRFSVSLIVYNKLPGSYNFIA